MALNNLGILRSKSNLRHRAVSPVLAGVLQLYYWPLYLNPPTTAATPAATFLPGVTALLDTLPGTKDTPTRQTYLVLKVRPLAQTWEFSKLGQADSLSVGRAYSASTLSVTQASPSLSSLLRGYIRNVKLHQTISAQHPHESQRGGEWRRRRRTELGNIS